MQFLILLSLVPVAIIIVFIIYFINNPINSTETKETIKTSRANYIATPLLTNYEWKNYQGLKAYCDQYNFIICPKVRLADLITPKNDSDRSTWQKRFNSIKAKHVDFVVCDEDMNVKIIIELDDRTHLRSDRQKRDMFVNNALLGAGYNVMHMYRFDDSVIEKLNPILCPELKPAPEEETFYIRRSEPSFEEWKESQNKQTAQTETE